MFKILRDGLDGLLECIALAIGDALGGLGDLRAHDVERLGVLLGGILQALGLGSDRLRGAFERGAEVLVGIGHGGEFHRRRSERLVGDFCDHAVASGFARLERHAQGFVTRGHAGHR